MSPRPGDRTAPEPTTCSATDSQALLVGVDHHKPPGLSIANHNVEAQGRNATKPNVLPKARKHGGEVLTAWLLHAVTVSHYREDRTVEAHSGGTPL